MVKHLILPKLQDFEKNAIVQFVNDVFFRYCSQMLKHLIEPKLHDFEENAIVQFVNDLCKGIILDPVNLIIWLSSIMCSIIKRAHQLKKTVSEDATKLLGAQSKTVVIQ